MSVTGAGATLPCPPLTIALDLPAEGAIDPAHFKSLPAKPGILAIENASGATLSLLSSANLRRAASTRLAPATDDQPRSRRIDLRGVARRLLATTVGSAFEADWAYLQIARGRLPLSYRTLLDRWQAWFIRCDPDQRFPQWIKTSRPGAPPTGTAGTHVGPFGDKHAAHRFIEMLEDAFDLCRYHHILIQAPHGRACAYKEMGRCPAPCDGTVSMQHYHQQMLESVAFAHSPLRGRAEIQSRMQQCSAAMDFEGAQRCKTLLDRTKPATRREFAHVRDLLEFRFVALIPAERRGWVRLMRIDGGWIEPVFDFSSDMPASDVRNFIADLTHRPARESSLSEQEIENIGVVCRRLLMPRAQAKRRQAEFLRLPEQASDLALLSKAIERIAGAPLDDDQDVAVEHELEGV